MWQERITIDPHILVGKPVIKGTRLSVELIIGLLGQGWTEQDIFESYPGVTREDVLACLTYASFILQETKTYPLATTDDSWLDEFELLPNK